VPGSGRRRQARTPLRRRLRLDLLAWGLLAGACASLVLGLTGGGWVKALVLGLFVVAGCGLLTLLAATSSVTGQHGQPRTPPAAPPAAPPNGPTEGPDDGSAP